MPRRKRSSKKEESGRKKRTRSRTRKKWTLDMKTVVPEVSKRVIESLGLDYIGIDIDSIKDLIEDIVSSIAEQRATKPSIDSLVSNIIRNKQLILKAIAAKLLQREDLTPEQVEFIVSYAPEIAGRAAPKLYPLAKKLGLDHVIDTLRYLWVRYGRPTPVECPYCGFRAVTPDLRCAVCGAQVSERDLKERIGFQELLEELAGRSPVAALEAVSAGFVLYDGERLWPPSAARSLSFYIEIYLNRSERELLERAARARITG
ncbi:MAG: hypothetical protein F7C35_02815 [Desulfurococcales archaeon]|nr:hypothetical protein [Desulfurococcales archaeon]